MKKLKIITSILICVLLLCLFACAPSIGDDDVSTSAPEQTEKIQELLSLVSDSFLPDTGNVQGLGSASYSEIYKDVDDMFVKSDDVVVVKVLDKYDIRVNHSDSGFEPKDTIRYVEVTYSYKNFYEVGDIVPIFQGGWVEEDGRELTMSGTPLLKPEQSVLLFVKNYDFSEYTDADWAKSFAAPLNEYHGKFYINHDGSIISSANLMPGGEDVDVVKGSKNLRSFEDVFELADKHKALETENKAEG